MYVIQIFPPKPNRGRLASIKMDENGHGNEEYKEENVMERAGRILNYINTSDTENIALQFLMDRNGKLRGCKECETIICDKYWITNEQPETFASNLAENEESATLCTACRKTADNRKQVWPLFCALLRYFSTEKVFGVRLSN